MVRIHQYSQFGGTVEHESWPVLTRDEVKEELHYQLSGFDDEEIERGVTICVDCVIDGEPIFNCGLLNTEGSREDVARQIDDGQIAWGGIQTFGYTVNCSLVDNDLCASGSDMQRTADLF